MHVKVIVNNISKQFKFGTLWLAINGMHFKFGIPWLAINGMHFKFGTPWLATYGMHLTLYRPGGHRCPLSPKFQFYFKKRSSEKFPMSVAPMSRLTKRAYLRLFPEKLRKREFGP